MIYALTSCSVVLWVMTSCSLVGCYKILEKHTASMKIISHLGYYGLSTVLLFIDSLIVKMKALQSFETLVTVHQLTWYNMPEDSNLQQYL
jgi:hypothetical protein